MPDYQSAHIHCQRIEINKHRYDAPASTLKFLAANTIFDGTPFLLLRESGKLAAMNISSPQATVTATESALKRIGAIIAKEADKTALRITVEGGGCSGFSYKFDLADDQSESDLVIEGHGGKVLIDEMSLIYMGGSEIDFVDDLMGQSFQVNNPNAVASCGCGTSFSI